VDLPTLAALADRCIPPDDLPGAVEAGALTYLLAQFERDLADMVSIYTARASVVSSRATPPMGSKRSKPTSRSGRSLVRPVPLVVGRSPRRSNRRARLSLPIHKEPRSFRLPVMAR
jgi:hypothetical protein